MSNKTNITMLRNYTDSNAHPYQWIDIVEPEEEGLNQVAEKFGLQPSTVQDILQPDHLPKYEKLGNYSFIILRVYDPSNDDEADTIPELTNKIAICISDQFIITIHNKEWQPLEEISNNFVKSGNCKDTSQLIIAIVRACLLSFDAAGQRLTENIEYFEEKVFLRENKIPLLKGLYFVKRKADVLQRLLHVGYEIIDKLDDTENSNSDSRDLRDLYVKEQTIFDTLTQSTNHLVSIYFNISSQRTNETIRVLTIFSVFFMPLTFIVGIYGMNFKFMPELNSKFGYPLVIVFMVIVTLCIYTWFKRKNWL